MDYISNIPDEIISYILSFLSTKSAVKTCILSKRWLYVWTKVPALDFTEMLYHHHRPLRLSDNQKMYFKNFLSKVLLQNDVSCLQYFTYSSSVVYDSHYIESFLRSAARREICELDLRLDFSTAIYLPRQFLCSQRLVVLKLSGFMINKMDHSSFHLPNLEIIRLINIRFDGDLFLKSLILGCTALKNLLIERCCGLDKTLYLESSTLESLKIQQFRIKTGYLMIHLRTPNLRYLHIRDSAARYDAGELKLLTEADLYFQYSKAYSDIPYHALELIKKITGVKSLRIGSSDAVVSCFANYIPKFENLIELKITANLVMYELLESAPKLKSLVIEEVNFVCESFYSKAVPGCMSWLENVQISIEKRSHIRLIGHILKVATALKKMKIYIHPDITRKRIAIIDQRILNLPISSPICQVEIPHYY